MPIWQREWQSQLLYKSTCKCIERESNTLDTNYNEKINYVREISDYISSDENIPDGLPQNQEAVSEQYISKNERDMWYSHPVGYSTGRIFHKLFCDMNLYCNVSVHLDFYVAHASKFT